jgi:threonine synthase
VLEIVRQSGGVAMSVSEDAIGRALHDAVAATGCWIGPEGAAGLAALEPLVARGVIRAGDRVVVFNTGSYEKYLPDLRHLLPVPSPTV